MTVTRLTAAAAGFALLATLAHPRAAGTPDLTVVSSTGLKAVMEALVPQFERATKHTVAIKYGLASAFKQQIEAGEAFDVAVLTPPLMDDLIMQGRIAAGTRSPIARTGLAIAIRKGAPRRDISTVDAFKGALLDAKSITYAKEGASGVAFAALIQKIDIADALKAKSTLTASGNAVGEAVAGGAAEFGVLPVSEILPIKGVEVLGTFPAAVQSYIVMVGGVSAHAAHDAAARELLAFLMAPGALPTLKEKGMERP